MTRILVTGASGLLGLNYCMQQAGRHSISGVIHHHKLKDVPFQSLNADLSDESEIEPLLEQVQPEVILHCAAMANIDACEKQAETAHRVNALLPGWLADASRRRGIFMAHISTDAVFDGQKGNYSEDDLPHPLSVYARTKLEGERQVLDANPEALVARVNFYGWSMSGKRSLAEWFFRNLSSGNDVNGFTDVVFCPLLVNDLVDVLSKMVELRLYGIYHTVSPYCLSKYDFGVLLARQFGFDETLIHPVSWKQGGLVAARSPNLTLNVEKMLKATGMNIPSQEEGMRRFNLLDKEGWRERMLALRMDPSI